MPIEEKKTYTFDGVEYATYGEALAAENKVNAAKTDAYDPTNDIAGLTKRFDVLMFGTKNQRENHPNEKFGWQKHFPVMLFVEDKWDKYHYLIDSAARAAEVAFFILKSRSNDDYWYHDQDAKLAKAIVEREAKNAALPFLEGRADGEYETFELKTFNKIVVGM